MRLIRNAVYEWERECMRKIFQMGEIEYKRWEVMEIGISLIRLPLNFSRRYIILAFVPKATAFTAENLQLKLVFSLCIRH
jgi:hypothetical protein